MLVEEGQAQHWMKTANWKSPEQSLEFQLSQPPDLLCDQACVMVKRLYLFMITTVDSKLFLKKILDSLWTLNSPEKPLIQCLQRV